LTWLGDVTLAEARVLFDALLLKYPNLGGHIGPDADIIHSPHFERGIAKLSQGGQLTVEETEAVAALRIVEVCIVLSLSLFIPFV
jgi:hypothetical protein